MISDGCSRALSRASVSLLTNSTAIPACLAASLIFTIKNKSDSTARIFLRPSVGIGEAGLALMLPSPSKGPVSRTASPMRILTRRSLLPVLGAIPIHWTTAPSPPQPVTTRLLLGGDVMLSRNVGRLARERRDPASPLRDLAPVFQSADLAFV